MLFFKQKQKTEDLLPPPPPSSDLELEQEIEEKPKFFDEVIKPKKSEPIPEEKEFSDLVKQVEGLKPKKTLRKSVKVIPKKKTSIKIQKTQSRITPQLKKVNVQQLKEGIEKQKSSAKEVKQLKKVEIKKLKEKTKPKKIAQIKSIKKEKLKLKKIKAIKRVTKKQQVEPPELGEDFGLKDIDFGLPKELEEPKEEIKLPETLEDFDIDELGKELEQKAKPNEILEAKEEIQSAIDKIKKKEKPSFFSKLFERKEKEKQEESYPTFSIPNGDGLSIIQNSIKKVRDALMKFDLETAKRNYIEIMRLYNNLSPQDKAKVYNDINELYYERKNAEELKI